jgi:hypothetical protein
LRQQRVAPAGSPQWLSWLTLDPVIHVRRLARRRLDRVAESKPRIFGGSSKHLAPSSQYVLNTRVDSLGAPAVSDFWGLYHECQLRRQSMDQILDARIDDEGLPLIYAMEAESRYSARSIPHAGSFTASSTSRRAEPANHPQIPPTRQLFRVISASVSLGFA